MIRLPTRVSAVTVFLEGEEEREGCQGESRKGNRRAGFPNGRRTTTKRTSSKQSRDIQPFLRISLREMKRHRTDLVLLSTLLLDLSLSF